MTAMAVTAMAAAVAVAVEEVVMLMAAVDDTICKIGTDLENSAL